MSMIWMLCALALASGTEAFRWPCELRPGARSDPLMSQGDRWYTYGYAPADGKEPVQLAEERAKERLANELGLEFTKPSREALVELAQLSGSTEAHQGIVCRRAWIPQADYDRVLETAKYRLKPHAKALLGGGGAVVGAGILTAAVTYAVAHARTCCQTNNERSTLLIANNVGWGIIGTGLVAVSFGFGFAGEPLKHRDAGRVLRLQHLRELGQQGAAGGTP